MTPLQQLLKWSVSDRRSRTISPLSQVTVSEWIENRIDEGTVERLRNALQVGAANARVTAHLGRRARREADLLTSRALKLAPDNDEVKELRNEVVELLGSRRTERKPVIFVCRVSQRVPLHLLSAREIYIRMRRAAFCFLLAVGISADACVAGPFVVFENTSSPDGRYAFAWGAPEKYKIDWAVLNRGETTALPNPADFADAVENYLVDLKAGKILATLSGAQAWQLPDGSHGNHRDLQVAWSPNGEFAVAIYSLKWQYELFQGFRITPEGVAAIEIGKPLETAWLQHLSKTAGQRYQQRADSLAISFSELKPMENEGTFGVRALAEVPKSVSEDDAFEEKLVFTLQPQAEGKLSLEIRDLSKP
jgi:hypothetical protein